MTVVVNPVSGQGRGLKQAETLAAALRDQGLRVQVVAVGGDGSVQSAVDVIARRDRRPALAHLPTGTTNAIARAFGLENDPGALAALIAADEVRTLDLGYLEDCDRYFLLMATVGDPTRVVAAASRELKNRLGFGAYIVAAARAVVSPKHASVTLQCDGELAGETPVTVVVCPAVLTLVTPAAKSSPSQR